MIRFVRKVEQKIAIICHTGEKGLLRRLGLIFSLSLVYALCSQIIIPMPFNLVPLSIQPMPIFACAYVFGWPAVSAYGLYLLQGALGAPVFAGLLGGIGRLLGPTGGYLMGFGFGAMMIALGKDYIRGSLVKNSVLYIISTVITFAFGIIQLSCFVPSERLLSLGFYPFFIGDFLIKPVFFLGLVFFFLRKKEKRSL